jgi:hypothetical protein
VPANTSSTAVRNRSPKYLASFPPMMVMAWQTAG